MRFRTIIILFLMDVLVQSCCYIKYVEPATGEMVDARVIDRGQAINSLAYDPESEILFATAGTVLYATNWHLEKDLLWQRDVEYGSPVTVMPGIGPIVFGKDPFINIYDMKGNMLSRTPYEYRAMKVIPLPGESAFIILRNLEGNAIDFWHVGDCVPIHTIRFDSSTRTHRQKTYFGMHVSHIGLSENGLKALLVGDEIAYPLKILQMETFEILNVEIPGHPVITCGDIMNDGRIIYGEDAGEEKILWECFPHDEKASCIISQKFKSSMQALFFLDNEGEYVTVLRDGQVIVRRFGHVDVGRGIMLGENISCASLSRDGSSLFCGSVQGNVYSVDLIPMLAQLRTER